MTPGPPATSLSLTQNGNTVTGTYFMAPVLYLVNGTVTGSTVSGTWVQPTDPVVPNDTGDFSFSMSADGSSFAGTWIRTGPGTGSGGSEPQGQGGSWTGTRPTPTPLPSPSPSASPSPFPSPSPTPTPTPTASPLRSLAVVAFGASPQSFLPPNSTTLSGSIVAQNFVPTDLRWTLTVSSPGFSRVFSGVGSSPLVPWNGAYSDRNPRVVVPGTYQCVLRATCAEGLAAEASTQVGVSVLLPTVKEISSKAIPLVDTSNEPITAPQYDSVSGARQPIALPSRHGSFENRVKVTIELIVPLDFEEQLLYTIWGEEPGTRRMLFTPTSVNFGRKAGVSRKQVDFVIDPPAGITRIPLVNWYFSRAGKPIDGGNFMGFTDSPILITLDMPRQPQKKPRIDVLTFAVDLAPRAEDEFTAAAYLTNGINGRAGFSYVPRRRHSEPGPSGRTEELIVSNFIPYNGRETLPEGNCEDFSALFQAAGASLGLPTELMRINRGILGVGFHTREVMPMGLEWRTTFLEFHQAGWLGNGIFEPTYHLGGPGNPILPVGLDALTYRTLLQDTTQQGDLYRVLPLGTVKRVK